MNGDRMEKTIKNLVFDVGNVMLGFRTEQMLADHGMDDRQIEVFEREVFENPLWAEFDYGRIPFDEVVRRFYEIYPQHAQDIRYLIEHCELMAIHRPRVWDMVHRLKEAGYRIYLLSNYSHPFLKAHVGGAPFFDDLDGAVISCDVHMIKPEPGIYEYLFRKYQLDPEECLFFDDIEENVKASRAAGMPARQVFGEEQLIRMLDALLEEKR